MINIVKIICNKLIRVRSGVIWAGEEEAFCQVNVPRVNRIAKH
jgi:hypothetical protein